MFIFTCLGLWSPCELNGFTAIWEKHTSVVLYFTTWFLLVLIRIPQTHHGCCSVRFPRCGCPGHSTPWPGNGILGHTPWCHLGPSCLAGPPCGLPQVGRSQTSCPPAGRCICCTGNTGSRSGGISGCFYSDHAFCFFLQWNIIFYVHIYLLNETLNLQVIIAGMRFYHFKKNKQFRNILKWTQIFSYILLQRWI